MGRGWVVWVFFIGVLWGGKCKVSQCFILILIWVIIYISVYSYLEWGFILILIIKGIFLYLYCISLFLIVNLKRNFIGR